MGDPLMGDPIHSAMTKLVTYLPNLIAAVILAFIFWVILKLTKRILSSAMLRANVPEEASDIVVRFAGYVVIIIAISIPSVPKPMLGSRIHQYSLLN
jgi:hypothetical protein